MTAIEIEAALGSRQSRDADEGGGVGAGGGRCGGGWRGGSWGGSRAEYRPRASIGGRSVAPQTPWWRLPARCTDFKGGGVPVRLRSGQVPRASAQRASLRVLPRVRGRRPFDSAQGGPAPALSNWKCRNTTEPGKKQAGSDGSHGEVPAPEDFVPHRNTSRFIALRPPADEPSNQGQGR